MKKLIILLLFPVMAQSQTVDNAVKQTMKPTVDSLREAIGRTQVPANVIWEEILQVNVSRSGNIDTITSAGLYQISVSGSATAVRIIAFNNGAIRMSNPLSWSGAGSWSASVINGRVIISTTGTGLIYQRKRL